jgi:hypothetical protein
MENFFDADFRSLAIESDHAQAQRRLNIFPNGEQIVSDAELRHVTDFVRIHVLDREVDAVPFDVAFCGLAQTRDGFE